ncbi:uncharacterized protein GlcG (DUF336 family) [Nitrobacteraceae bacterium AZCC 2161]
MIAIVSIERLSKKKNPHLPNLTLIQARNIIDASLAKSRELSLSPLTVAVLDAGGHLIALNREDNSGILRVDIAIGKAWGALGMGYGSREIFERSKKAPSFIEALTAASKGRLIPGAGGVLIRDNDNVTMGAVGISGDTSDNDETCAVAGIESIGLRPMIGAE